MNTTNPIINRILIWDIPSRIFHWAFASSLTVAILIGFLADDDQPLFQLHMIFGIVAMFLLVLRIVMGVVGSRYSRFSSYPVHPRELFDYMISASVSKTKLYDGNNPGSAMAAVLMFLLIPALFLSGIEYGGEVMEELHEFFSWALLVVIVMHLAGLAWHTFRHQENISLAMITGKKSGKPEDAIESAHSIWGVVFLMGAGLWIGALFANHSSTSATVTLPGIGVTVHLGEHESGGEREDDDHDDDGDDDD
jgi:cytochrome b